MAQNTSKYGKIDSGIDIVIPRGSDSKVNMVAHVDVTLFSNALGIGIGSFIVGTSFKVS